MYQQTNDPDIILDLETGTFIPRGHYLWPEDESQIEPMPAPTLADAANALMGDVQRWLDGTAGQNGYNSLESCVSYINSAVPQYKADATAAIAWRDAVWTACFQWQQSASSNPPAMLPTSTEVIAELPQSVTFGWIVHAPGAPSA